MKIDIISFFILLVGFVSISVADELQSDLVQKISDQIEADDFDDDRPKEIQELEETFEDGLDTFIKQGLQDFKDIAFDLNKAINSKTNPDNKSNANEKKPSLFRSLNCFSCMFSSYSTESDSKEKFDEREFDRIHLLAKKFATHLENFKEYFKSIRGLNNGLMDQLKEVFNKIITVSFDKPIEPEKEIGMQSIGSSSIFDENNIEDIKKTLIDMIPVISQAMTCRFKVVYVVNWIRVRLDYIKNNVEWMTLREELVKLMQTYGAIEINFNEYLTFNEMISNPGKRDDSKVKKVMDYLKETIEEGKFNSMTEEIIEKIERLDMKPGSIKTIDDFNGHRVHENTLEVRRQVEQLREQEVNEISSINRELLLEYFNVCEQEMIHKVIGTTDRMRRERERMRRDRRRYRSVYDNENEYERNRYRNQYDSYRDNYSDDEDESDYSNNLNQLQQEMNTIRSTLVSSNDFDEMVAKTIEAIETLMNQRIITDSDSEPLNRFIQNIQDILEQELEIRRPSSIV